METGNLPEFSAHTDTIRTQTIGRLCHLSEPQPWGEDSTIFHESNASVLDIVIPMSTGDSHSELH